MATGGVNLSKEFFDLLKAIGESKSKQEEDRIIAKEVVRLKQKLETPASSGPGSPPPTNQLLSSKKRAKEFLVRLLYVEMLGHDGSFGYIKAVEMAASSSLFHKRTGYLVCSACLSPEHEFRFMLVNQMQRDLQSSNVLEICGGVLAASALITEDMVPAVQGEVVKLVSHESDTVRKKAVVTLHRFYQLAPESVTREDLIEKLRKVLCDRDPSVMGASLNVIEALASEDATMFKDLIPSLVSILKQIGEHRLPSDFDYHRVPAPWLQMKLVRILGIVGKADAQASSGMYEILMDALQKADVGVNAGYAVVYEIVKTIAVIYPNPKLLDAAGEAISRFIRSRSHNLKYLGVTGLAMIVEGHPQYAAQHQIAVMDCLEDPDETLQRKTLDLLYRMTNPVNVEFITERLLEFLRGTTDLFLKNVLTKRVCSVAERYAPNNAWYIRTITQLFEVSGDMVSGEVAQNLMTLIAEGTGDSEEADMLLRQNAVELYVGLLRDKPGTATKLPKILLETISWVLGEYGYLSAICSLDDVLKELCGLAMTKAALTTSTRKFLITAIMKLVSQAGNCPPHAAAVIDGYTRSKDFDLQQRCLEFQTLLTTAPQILGEVFPVDASAEDIDVDPNLSFLSGYVQQQLNNGARPYDKPEDDDDDDDLYDGSAGGGGGKTSSGFKMTPYEKPQTAGSMAAMRGMGHSTTPSLPGVSLPPGAGYGGNAGAPPAPVQSNAPGGELTLNTRNVANVWGKTPAAAPAAPAPAPAASSGGFAASTGGFSSTPSTNPYLVNSPAPAPEPQKTAAQLEKERKAAALFGGVVPGAPAPPPPASAPAAVTRAAARAAPAPAPPPPAPAPAPEVDLLDMSMWDAPAPAPPAANVAVDIFAAAPLPAAAPAAAAPQVLVETASDEDDEAAATAVAAAAPAAAAPAPPLQPNLDPFSAEGLLGDLTDAPLATLATSQKFEFNGVPLAPLEITTAQFGQQWGGCAGVTPLEVTSSKVSTLQQFMDVCSNVGVHPVESITSTNEGICAGMIGGTHVTLIHGKVTPGAMGSKLNVTVKSTDPAVTGPLAMYLQTMLR